MFKTCLFLLSLIALVLSQPAPPATKATCAFNVDNGQGGWNGQITITDALGLSTNLQFAITGYPENTDFTYHIHQYGIADSEDGCGAAITGGHYNPTAAEEGELSNRHGAKRDLSFTVTDDAVKLGGPYGVLGRSIVFHNASGGARLACCNIMLDADPYTKNVAFEGEFVAKNGGGEVVVSGDGALGNITFYPSALGSNDTSAVFGTSLNRCGSWNQKSVLNLSNGPVAIGYGSKHGEDFVGRHLKVGDNGCYIAVWKTAQANYVAPTVTTTDSSGQMLVMAIIALVAVVLF